MDVDIDAKVVAADGRKVGKVTHVIVDPSAKKVVDLIIELQRGFLDVREVVVPVDAVISATKAEVRLAASRGGLNKLPDFIETEYVAPPAGWYPPVPIPPGGILWPAGYGATFIQNEKRNVPEGTVTIDTDTDVYCSDGHIGIVDDVVFDATRSRLTGFVVRQGTLLTHDVFVPIDYVAEVLPDRVVLNRSKAEVARLNEKSAGA